MSEAILFDLGNTLVRYYRKEEFVPILQKAISSVHVELVNRNLISSGNGKELLNLAKGENREAEDFSFTPLSERLERIFGIPIVEDAELSQKLGALFLEPIFQIAHLYPDTLDALGTLRDKGYKLGVVSNLPWGSSPDLWRAELQKRGIADLVNDVTLCADVGWRKPAAQIFERAVENLNTSISECIFVGDDLIWDVHGSEKIGMRPVLIDRENLHQNYDGLRVGNLKDLDQLLC